MVQKITKKHEKLLVWLAEAGYKALYHDWHKTVTVLTQEFQAEGIVEIMRRFGFSGSFYELTGLVYGSGDKEVQVYAKIGEPPVKNGIYMPVNALAYAFELQEI